MEALTAQCTQESLQDIFETDSEKDNSPTACVRLPPSGYGGQGRPGLDARAKVAQRLCGGAALELRLVARLATAHDDAAQPSQPRPRLRRAAPPAGQDFTKGTPFKACVPPCRRAAPPPRNPRHC